ncbi:hypothetical protein TRVL_01563 [Trypanosoma vivax]|nr:hypothetical protein TRVL_01563 [Trypanosoma vivax]
MLFCDAVISHCTPRFTTASRFIITSHHIFNLLRFSGAPQSSARTTFQIWDGKHEHLLKRTKLTQWGWKKGKKRQCCTDCHTPVERSVAIREVYQQLRSRATERVCITLDCTFHHLRICKEAERKKPPRFLTVKTLNGRTVKTSKSNCTHTRVCIITPAKASTIIP